MPVIKLTKYWPHCSAEQEYAFLFLWTDNVSFPTSQDSYVVDTLSTVYTQRVALINKGISILIYQEILMPYSYNM